MVKALSALAISAGRFDVRIVVKDCTNQTWPNFSASCPYGENSKLEPRRVGADRAAR